MAIASLTWFRRLAQLRFGRHEERVKSITKLGRRLAVS
jgi:hypothetical protein